MNTREMLEMALCVEVLAEKVYPQVQEQLYRFSLYNLNEFPTTISELNAIRAAEMMGWIIPATARGMAMRL